MNFGDLIKKFRIRKNLNQTELSDALGISQPYYARLEESKQKPPPIEKTRILITRLSLSNEESLTLLELAFNERLNDEGHAYLLEINRLKEEVYGTKDLTDDKEVVDAIGDYLNVEYPGLFVNKELIELSKNKEFLKFLSDVSGLPPEEREKLYKMVKAFL